MVVVPNQTEKQSPKGQRPSATLGERFAIEAGLLCPEWRHFPPPEGAEDRLRDLMVITQFMTDLADAPGAGRMEITHEGLMAVLHLLGREMEMIHHLMAVKHDVKI